MTGEELGRVLGDAISELQNASMEIEGTLDMLMSIDGRSIIPERNNDGAAEARSCMTVEELGELLGDALSALDSAAAGVEGAGSILRSIDGNALDDNFGRVITSA